MEKFTKITSQILPLPIKDIDTDMIIPANFMTSTSKTGYGPYLFQRLKEASADFPANNPQYQGAQIMVTDHNFGCGSSREHAVWAILDTGFRVVIAKSFADIFFNNSAKNGLLLLTLPENIIDQMIQKAQNTTLSLTLDLEKQEITLPESEIIKFEYDAFRKHCLLNGMDDIDYILSYKEDIDNFRATQNI